MIFVLDTNVLWNVPALERLATAVRGRGHRVQVPALVYAERVAQVRRALHRHGKVFDQATIDAFYRTHEFEIVPFDQDVAHRCAQALADSFPTREHWHVARRDRCEARFRPAQVATGEACSATVDWYNAASYTADPFFFVTQDGGTEFTGMRTISLDDAIRLAGGE